VLGHKISYVGGYTRTVFDRNGTGGDDGNLLVGHSVYQVSTQVSTQTTHELRVASDGPGHLIDYTFGYFHSKGRSRSFTDQTQVFLRGAFGPSATNPDPTLLNLRYTLPLSTIVPPGGVTENSFFASATIHVGSKTEITLGGRYLLLHQNIQLTSSIASGFVVATQDFGLPCSALGAGLVTSNYPGFCDFPVGPIGVVAGFRKDAKYKPFVYSASASHHFTDDILAYATVASSYRLGFVNIGVSNGNNDPVLQRLSLPTPEKSTSFELGLKTKWLDNRLRLNVSGFYQKFKGLLYQTPPVPYRSVNGPSDGVSVFGFNTNANAIVKGVNIDLAFQPTPNWSISGGFNYSKANVDNDTIPCRDANFDGVADNGTPTLQDFKNHNTYVALCKSKEAITRDPLWNATLQSEFSQPIGAAEGYVRGLLTYYPKNPRRSPGFTVDNYALLNLYTGIRSPDGAWDVGIFARNITNTGVQLSRGLNDVSQGNSAADFFGPSGYVRASYTPPRQFGINVRYAFGSR
jgi:iron complex outermembrane receptor protein